MDVYLEVQLLRVALMPDEELEALYRMGFRAVLSAGIQREVAVDQGRAAYLQLRLDVEEEGQGAGAYQVEAVAVQVESHDQGWSSYPDDRNTYNNSWTWGELVLAGPDGEVLGQAAQAEPPRLYTNLHAPVPHRPPPSEDPRKVFDRFIRDQPAISKYIDVVDMVSRWHWGVPAAQLTRGNVADLLCYGFFYRSQQQLAAEGMGHLPDQLVSEIEAAWGVKFREGPYTPLPMMTHLWEPVRCFYRPLFFYAGVELLILLKHVMMLAAGFRAHMHSGMRYYTYGLPAPTAGGAANALRSPGGRGRRQAAATAPVLFLHGVGLGILPYLNFLLRLSSLGRPVVAVEVRHLSMRACWEVPEEDEVVARVFGALQRHGVQQVHVAAHSYGTFMASRLVQLHKPTVASLTLLDPVCFVMFSGKLIYNFVYRSPLKGASLLTWFIARDMAHSVSVSRRFYWSLLNLWPDQLPDHTMVALSAQDELVPVQEVLTMLEAHPATRVLMHPTHRHADFIKDLPWQARMVQEVAELIHAASGGHMQHTRSDSASSYEVMAGLGSGGGK
ncbi:hypothetical protein GPECTOR_10g949 [Gonium pectorale]|uniref:AB hydrolase-1 domain-containing protein n=1 Tax=Gonium pectorale TaxID=33097 RepID=A0A150GR84_GONPE|nr:hypothetical protein GPECTOR_10g949 [Gonium pectorale]|eukprot:KXZ52317.1 hypothetical protein GPECTOR_10g949 [Gonium pectorale]